jgi:Xaa-Pro dipeptidase
MREARYSKSAEEVAYLEEAARAAEAGLRAGNEGLRAGLGRAGVWGQMVLAMAHTGSDLPPVAGVDLLWTGEDWEGPGSRTGANGILLIHTRGAVSGYGAAVHQPVALGSLPRSWQEAWHVFLEAWRGSWEVLWPGVSFERVAEAAQAAGAGPYRVRQVLRGQGLGDDLPWIPAEGAPPEMVREPTLVEGACFLVQPEIHWTEERGSYWLTWGDTVLVTEDGPRRLGSRPIEFPSIDISQERAAPS